jgi:hypothetical protein
LSKGVLAHVQKVGEFIRKQVSAPMPVLIKKLNQTLLDWANISKYIQEQIDIINEYWIYLFESELDKPSQIKNEEFLGYYLGKLFRKTKAKIHIKFGGPVEAAFDLGALFAANLLEPPETSEYETITNEIKEKLRVLDIKIDENLSNVLNDIRSENIDIRDNVRKEVLNRIETQYRDKTEASWLKGFEVNIGIPNLAQIEKEW